MSENKYLQKAPQLSDEQLRRAIELAIEGETLTKIADELCITTQMLYVYRQHFPDFATIFERARQEGLEKLADDLITLADDIDDVQRARLKSDNYKWLLSKRKPAVYGDKVDIHVSQTIDISGALDDAKKRIPKNATIPLDSLIDITPNKKPNDNSDIDE